MSNLTRRESIQTGAAGLAVLALANCAHAGAPAASFNDPNYAYRVLGAADRTMIAAIARVMLAGALPTDTAANAASIVQTVRGVDTAVADLPSDFQQEFVQLFTLLAFPVTRAFVAGIWSSWSGAGSAEIASFLTRWRYSGIPFFRSGYQGLHEVVMASWYGTNASWARIGYPGPPHLA